MTFWNDFLPVLRWRPRQALVALFWQLTRRRVRARNLLLRGVVQGPLAYQHWLRSVEDLPAVGDRARTDSERWRHRPKFTVLLHLGSTASLDQARQTIASVEAQFYPNWEFVIVGAVPPDDLASAQADEGRIVHLPANASGASEALAGGIVAARGEYLVPLRIGQFLSPAALFRLAEVLQDRNSPSIIYGDQDEIDMTGKRLRPWFKPQWDAEMLLAQDYLSEACAVEIDLARRVLPVAETSDEATIYAWLLEASRAARGPIVHVPYVLSHVGPEMKRPSQPARLAVVERHVSAFGARSEPGPFDTIKVKWPLPTVRPAVSIIVPTRDKVHLLRACVESVLQSTDYPDFELIVVDNGSADPEALSYLSQIDGRSNVRVLRYDRPYNYSAINNFAAERASFDYLCLLNNDTEIITPEWLSEMMRYAVRPEVGAVGAKLLYDDGSIQHAGVIVGICEAAGHAHRFVRGDDPGYFAQPHLAHRVTAVTAACLVVEKRKFEAVGGLDAEKLPVAYNDVDLCLKLQQAGWHNMYVPHAVLLHHESKSRGQDSSPENIDRYMRELNVLQERWGTKTYEDPRHHINLDRYSENFRVRL